MSKGLLTAAAWAAMQAEAPGAACAEPLPEHARALLDRGRPYVDVSPDPDGSSGVVRAAIDVSAPEAVVFKVMADCELAPRMVARVKSCRILDRDPLGRWDVREEVLAQPFAPAVRTVYREEFDPPHGMSFRRTDGDLKVFEGQWRLEPKGEGVRVTYEAKIAAPFAVPGWVARLALRHDLPQALLALRREALARTPVESKP